MAGGRCSSQVASGAGTGRKGSTQGAGLPTAGLEPSGPSLVTASSSATKAEPAEGAPEKSPGYPRLDLRHEPASSGSAPSMRGARPAGEQLPCVRRPRGGPPSLPRQLLVRAVNRQAGRPPLLGSLNSRSAGLCPPACSRPLIKALWTHTPYCAPDTLGRRVNLGEEGNRACRGSICGAGGVHHPSWPSVAVGGPEPRNHSRTTDRPQPPGEGDSGGAERDCKRQRGGDRRDRLEGEQPLHLRGVRGTEGPEGCPRETEGTSSCRPPGPSGGATRGVEPDRQPCRKPPVTAGRSGRTPHGQRAQSVPGSDSLAAPAPSCRQAPASGRLLREPLPYLSLCLLFCTMGTIPGPLPQSCSKSPPRSPRHSLARGSSWD